MTHLEETKIKNFIEEVYSCTIWGFKKLNFISLLRKHQISNIYRTFLIQECLFSKGNRKNREYIWNTRQPDLSMTIVAIDFRKEMEEGK